jgi:hypothetical protein
MPSRTTSEELHIVRDLVLLYQCLETLTFRLERSAAAERDQVQRIIDKVTADFAALKIKLKSHDIHVFLDKSIDKYAYIEYPFVCRGYDDRLFTLKDHYRGLIKEKIREYKA